MHVSHLLLFDNLENSVLKNGHFRFVKNADRISEHCNLVPLLVTYLSLGVVSAARFDPNVTIRANNDTDSRLSEKLHKMVLHSANMIAVNLNQNSVLEKAVLLVPGLDHDSAVEAADLLNFSDDKVPFDEVLPHV